MRKISLIILSILLLSSLLCFVACTKDEVKLLKETEYSSFEVVYNNETGKVSWADVNGANSYKIYVVTYQKSNIKEYTTKESECQLSLPSGINHISVHAFDNQSCEIATGACQVSLENAFGCLEMVEGLTIDRENNKFVWTKQDKALGYVINVTNKLTKEIVVENKEVKNNFYEFESVGTGYNIGKGVYDVEVVSIAPNGAESPVSKYTYVSYRPFDFDTLVDETNGIYNLYSFEEEGIMDVCVDSTYKGWSTGKVYPVELSISNRIDSTSKAFVITQNEVIGTGGSAIQYFGGKTFYLAEPIDFGTLYFDAYRSVGTGIAVILKDDNGVELVTRIIQNSTDEVVAKRDKATHKQYGEVVVAKGDFEGDFEAFTKIRTITFVEYNGKTGVFGLDNIRYSKNPLSEITGIEYDELNNKLVWNKVNFAQTYEVNINNTTYTTSDNYLDFNEHSIPKKECTVIITAKNGEYIKSQEYIVKTYDVGVKDIAEGAILLTDFISPQYGKITMNKSEVTVVSSDGVDNASGNYIAKMVQNGQGDSTRIEYELTNVFDVTGKDGYIVVKGKTENQIGYVTFYDNQGSTTYLSVGSLPKNKTFTIKIDLSANVGKVKNISKIVIKFVTNTASPENKTTFYFDSISYEEKIDN